MRRSFFVTIWLIVAMIGMSAFAAAQNSTTLTVTSSVTDPEPYGVLPISLNVSSTSGTPSGFITYTVDGGSPFGAGPVDSSGNNTIDLAPLNVGSHTVVFTFGDPNNVWAGSSVSQAINVVANALTITITNVTGNVSYGQSPTINVTVSGGAHSGVLALWSDDGMQLESQAPFTQGTSVFNSETPPKGDTHNLFVTFTSLDGNTIAAQSNLVPITVGTVNPQMLVFSRGNVQVGQTATIEAQLQIPPSLQAVNGVFIPHGTVDFNIDGTDYGSLPLNVVSGFVDFTIGSLGVGAHNVIATYSGDVDYNPATATCTQVIAPVVVSTTTTLSTDAPTYTYGQAVTAFVHVDSGGFGAPAGTVTINDQLVPNGASAPVGTAALDGNGNATISVSGLAASNHILTAIYTPSGNSQFLASTSNAVTIVVNPAPVTVTLSGLSQTYNSAPESVTVATNPSVSAAVTYNGSAAAPTNAGSYSVVATVTDPNYTGSASGTLVIGKATLVVTAANASKFLNAANPALSGTLTGVQGSDGITASYSTTATTKSDVGTYPITASLNDPNGKLSNYTVANNPGVLTIAYAGNSGVLSPINPNGSTKWVTYLPLPVRFQVFDANHNTVTTPGVVTDTRLVAIDGAPTNQEAQSYLNTGWFALGNTWTFLLNTNTLATGHSYSYTIFLKDGSTIQFSFKL